MIGRNEAGQRLDKYLRKLLKEAPDGFLYKMLRKKNITLEGRRASGNEMLAEGMSVKLFLSEETFEKMAGQEALLPAGRKKGGKRAFSLSPENIVYEDRDLVLVNKPPGVLVHSRGAGEETLAGALLSYLASPGKLDRRELAAFRPAPMNRLDMNTSGLVLCGASLPGEQFLARAIRERTIRKEYLCVVRGSFPFEGKKSAYLAKDGRRNRVFISEKEKEGMEPIETAFYPLAESGGFTLLKVLLISGKPHQIRAHLACLGYPLPGDPKYGDPELNARIAREAGLFRQCLHAHQVTFLEAEGEFGRLRGRTFTAPCPKDFIKVLKVTGLE